jgi:hypothetical protein
MSEDLTNKLRPNTDDNVTLILMAVQDLTFRVGMSEHKFEDFAEKLDRRLNDSDAILQKVVLDIAHLQEGQLRLEEGQRGLQEGQRGLQEGQRGLQEGQRGLQEGQKRLHSDLTAFRQRVDQQFRTLSGEVERRYREHDQRIARLETNANQANPQT